MFLCVRQSVKFPSITCTCSMLVYPGRDVCAFVPEGGVPVKKSYRLRYHIIYRYRHLPFSKTAIGAKPGNYPGITQFWHTVLRPIPFPSLVSQQQQMPHCQHMFLLPPPSYPASNCVIINLYHPSH